MANITVKIKGGKISLDVEGVNDASCSDLTKALTNALGVVEEVSNKPAYYSEIDNMETHIYETEE